MIALSLEISHILFSDSSSLLKFCSYIRICPFVQFQQFCNKSSYTLHPFNKCLKKRRSLRFDSDFWRLKA